MIQIDHVALTAKRLEMQEYRRGAAARAALALAEREFRNQMRDRQRAAMKESFARAKVADDLRHEHAMREKAFLYPPKKLWSLW